MQMNRQRFRRIQSRNRHKGLEEHQWHGSAFANHAKNYRFLTTPPRLIEIFGSLSHSNIRSNILSRESYGNRKKEDSVQKKNACEFRSLIKFLAHSLCWQEFPGRKAPVALSSLLQFRRYSAFGLLFKTSLSVFFDLSTPEFCKNDTSPEAARP